MPQHGNTLGAADAPATLTVYEDPQCPFCRDWALGTLPSVVENYVRPGRLKLVYNGVQIIGPNSQAGLRAIYAAGRQNKLWNLADALYRRQGAENSGWITDAVISEAAASVGANGAAIRAAAPTPVVTAQLISAARQASVDRVQGTPTFVLQRPPSPAAAAERDRTRPRHVRVGARGRPAVSLRRAIAVAALAGIAVAAYLTVVHYTHTSPICTTGGCEKVQHSSYAKLAGIPVALLGLVAYVAILGTSLVRGVGRGARRCRARAERRCVQRLPAVGAARADRRDLPVVPRERRNHRGRRCALCRAAVARALSGEPKSGALFLVCKSEAPGR